MSDTRCEKCGGSTWGEFATCQCVNFIPSTPSPPPERERSDYCTDPDCGCGEETFRRLRAEIAALRKDQNDWRKGVALIRASIFPKEWQPADLSCADIAEAVLRVGAERDALREALERLCRAVESLGARTDDALADARAVQREHGTHVATMYLKARAVLQGAEEKKP